MPALHSNLVPRFCIAYLVAQMSASALRIVCLENQRNATRRSGVLSFKLTVFDSEFEDSGRVAIQMREVCESFAKDKTKWLFHEWWRSRKHDVAGWLAMHGFAHLHIRPSARALAARTDDLFDHDPVRKYVQQEWICTLSAMLFTHSRLFGLPVAC